VAGALLTGNTTSTVKKSAPASTSRCDSMNSFQVVVRLRNAICWSVVRVKRMKSIPQGDGTLLDHCWLLYMYEHAEDNVHKNNGLVAILAGNLHG
jgi:hypothetical protein